MFNYSLVVLLLHLLLSTFLSHFELKFQDCWWFLKNQKGLRKGVQFGSFWLLTIAKRTAASPESDRRHESLRILEKRVETPIFQATENLKHRKFKKNSFFSKLFQNLEKSQISKIPASRPFSGAWSPRYLLDHLLRVLKGLRALRVLRVPVGYSKVVKYLK